MALFSRSSEAIFRDQFLSFLITERGYPQGRIAKEMPLSLFRGEKGKARDRRADLLVFSREKELPLLLIECKRSRPSQRALYQVLGYNSHLQAAWCAIVWPEGYLLVGQGKTERGMLSLFPFYSQLHAVYQK